MKNVCIQIPVECPYTNPLTISARPVFVPGPDKTAWGEWIFGVDEGSLFDQVHGRKLNVNGTAPGALTFTSKTYVPFEYPNGLVATGFSDSTDQTLIYAVKRDSTILTRYIGGTATSSAGTGLLRTSNGSFQLFKRVGGSTQISSIPSSQVNALADSVFVVAITDEGETSRAQLLGVTSIATIEGAKTLAGPPQVGPVAYSTANYQTSPEYYGARFYSRALSIEETVEAMAEFRARIDA